jgi:hypothetical protein
MLRVHARVCPTHHDRPQAARWRSVRSTGVMPTSLEVDEQSCGEQTGRDRQRPAGDYFDAPQYAEDGSANEQETGSERWRRDYARTLPARISATLSGLMARLTRMKPCRRWPEIGRWRDRKLRISLGLVHDRESRAFYLLSHHSHLKRRAVDAAPRARVTDHESSLPPRQSPGTNGEDRTVGLFDE